MPLSCDGLDLKLLCLTVKLWSVAAFEIGATRLWVHLTFDMWQCYTYDRKLYAIESDYEWPPDDVASFEIEVVATSRLNPMRSAGSALRTTPDACTDDGF